MKWFIKSGLSSKRGDWGSKEQATAYLRKYPDKPMPLAWDPQWVREAVSLLDTQRDESRTQQIAQETSAVTGISEEAA